jgi:hypothetical protein
MSGRRLLSAAGTLVAVAIASGIAYAAIPGPGNVFAACMLRGVGTIRLIDKSLPSANLMSHCTDREAEISWNQAGQPGAAGAQGAPGAPGTNGTDGKDGFSVTTAAEPAGTNCAGGGVQLTAVSGVSYVCNGASGQRGEQGPEGPPGPSPFTAVAERDYTFSVNDPRTIAAGSCLGILTAGVTGVDGTEHAIATGRGVLVWIPTVHDYGVQLTACNPLTTTASLGGETVSVLFLRSN